MDRLVHKVIARRDDSSERSASVATRALNDVQPVPMHDRCFGKAIVEDNAELLAAPS